jgi:hypothetical protein
MGRTLSIFLFFSVLLAFFQSYIEHDLRKKNKIIVHFFANKLIFMI